MTDTVSDTGLPVFYSFRRCPYAMRARLAVAVSGMETQLREVVLRDKPAAMLAVSPKATVPVLVLPDGQVLEESLDVMLHALQHHGDPEGWLSPETGDLQQMLALIAAADDGFKKALDRYKYPNRYHTDEMPCDPLEWRQKAVDFLQVLANRLTESKQQQGDAFLFGSRPVLADFAILPFLRQFANVDRVWFDEYCAQQAGQGLHEWALLKGWLDGFLTSEQFLSIMPKVAQWQPDDPVTIFPFAA